MLKKTKWMMFINLIAFGFTVWGVIMLIRGDTTNGLLVMILSELMDMPIRIAHYMRKV